MTEIFQVKIGLSSKLMNDTFEFIKKRHHLACANIKNEVADTYSSNIFYLTFPMMIFEILIKNLIVTKN